MAVDTEAVTAAMAVDMEAATLAMEVAPEEDLVVALRLPALLEIW